MKSYDTAEARLIVEASSLISAPLEKVWSILIDFPHYGEWNTFVPKLQASLHIGSPLKMFVRMRKGFAVTMYARISQFDPPHQAAWKVRLPYWFLHSERVQILTAPTTETTQYWTREAFAGLVAPLLKLLFARDLQRGFDAVAHGLKLRAEAERFPSTSEVAEESTEA